LIINVAVVEFDVVGEVEEQRVEDEILVINLFEKLLMEWKHNHHLHQHHHYQNMKQNHHFLDVDKLY
jgi:hypothetical protein